MNRQTAISKAFEINKNAGLYGAFAEIGAGQETVNFFYKAGKASQTVAKSMSAYDMTVSDEIYGKQSRYVSKERLSAMLGRECRLLERRLKKKAGGERCFFSYAATAAAGSKKKSAGLLSLQHAWIGIRFQAKPRGPFNEVFFHVSCLDRNRLQQHEALGIIGVNLIHACFYRKKTAKKFISSLADNLSGGRVQIQGMSCQGPAFKNFSAEAVNLELLRQNLSHMAYFPKAGAGEYLYDSAFGKSLVILYGKESLIKLFKQKKSKLLKAFGLKESQAIFIFFAGKKSLKSGLINKKLNRLCRKTPVIAAPELPLDELKNLISLYTEKPIQFIVSEEYFKEKLFKASSYSGSLLKALGCIFDDKAKAAALSAGKSFSIESYKTKERAAQNLKDYLAQKKQIISV